MLLVAIFTLLLLESPRYYSSPVTASSNNDTAAIFSDVYNTTERNSNVNLICPNITVEHEDYELLPNGSVHIKKYALSLNDSFYHLENNTVTICKPENEENDFEKITPLPCLSMVGLIVALTSLFVQLSAFWFIDDLNNMPCFNLSISTAGLVTLFAALLLLQFDTVEEYQPFWYSIPTITHFYLVSSFSWLSIMSTEIFLISPRFSPKTRRVRISGFIVTVYAFKWLNFWTVAMAFTYLNIGSLMHIPQYVEPEKDDFCWLVMKEPMLPLFSGQVMILFLMNIIFFGCDTLYFRKTQHVLADGTLSPEFENLRVKLRDSHVKLFLTSMAMYFIWIIGALASIPSIRWMFWVFCALHSIVSAILVTMMYNFFHNLENYNMVGLGFQPQTIITRALGNCPENPAYDIRK